MTQLRRSFGIPARKPTGEEIDAFFEKLSLANLRVVLGSSFGVDVLVQERG